MFLPANTPENITCIPEVSPDLRDPNGWMRGLNVIRPFDYQAPQNADDPCLSTYKVLSPIGQNPAGLFMRLRVIEGHAPPVEWLQRFFGTTVGIDPDANPDGDGNTTWEEFLSGTVQPIFTTALCPP